MSLTHRVILSLICALALVLAPYSYAQEPYQSQPSTQDQVEQDRQDTNQDTDVDTDVDINQDRDTTDDAAAGDDTEDDDDLPDTAGGLPLLALIGLSSLIASRFARK